MHVFIDLSDPGDSVDFSDLLYDNKPFSSAMYNSLNEEGVFIAQTGIAANLDDPNVLNSRSRHSFVFKERLEEAGFKTVKGYDDVSCILSYHYCAEHAFLFGLSDPTVLFLLWLISRTAASMVFGAFLSRLSIPATRYDGTPTKPR